METVPWCYMLVRRAGIRAELTELWDLNKKSNNFWVLNRPSQHGDTASDDL